MWSSNLDTSTSFEGGFMDNQNDGQTDKKLRRTQNILPVMIGHILSVSSVDKLQIWDIPARMFMIVGIVRHIEETAMKISYDIEDETGTITALKWLEADRKTVDIVMEANTYVNVIGFLREQNDKRHILIMQIYPLEDLNELTNHILEVTYTTLKAEAMAKKNKELENNQDNTMVDQGPSEDSPYYGMSKDQTLVYKIIHAQNDTESGIERSDIKTQVPKGILPEINNILDFLVSEGHIYTTSTDDHFKTT
ncbi:replication protein A 32 kDa subunit [Ptiloglossa arizonensis]|uniref:replication protein A 32 kDa subunit n=1 Tax=Ptiloglossa arizonensis TaxID=3350558 RepID=UPI003F9FCA54